MSVDTVGTVWIIEIKRRGKWMVAGYYARTSDDTSEKIQVPAMFFSRESAQAFITVIRKSGDDEPMRIVRFKRHKEFEL